VGKAHISKLFPGTPMKNELLKDLIANAARITRSERIALVRQGEPRFAEPNLVADETRFGFFYFRMS